jgi:Plavaka transposase
MDIWAAHSAPFNQSAPFDNDKELKQRIDEINLEKMPWSSYNVRYTGEVPLLRPSAWMKKTYEVWYRDPRQVVHNILANEDFNGEFDYTPFREMRDGKREWSDFMSGNWAWNQAVKLCSLLFPHDLTNIFF